MLVTVLAGVSCLSDSRAESDPFPLYPCIEPNVDFWTQIYSHYTSTQGVIHDKFNLNRIYAVITLEDASSPGSRKINKQRIIKAKKQYRSILAKLSRGGPPDTPKETQVRALFAAGSTAADFRSAMRNIRCQVGQKDRFRAGLVRSGAYISAIKQEFRQTGLPEDLAYLPHVESSFNLKAYSKFGAAGIWQFTRSTGKTYMRVDYIIDERLDPVFSSFAAAKFLKDNFQNFKSWPMAITAYNHGPGGMQRARKSHGTYEEIFKRYRSRLFRFASRNFYSEFLAAREVADNYSRYFPNLELDSPAKNHEIELAGYASLPEIAGLLGVDISEFRSLNPALRTPVFRGQKYVPPGYRLRLPAKSDRGSEVLTLHLPAGLYRADQKRSRVYKVCRGDTAGYIARIHHVRLNDLLAANDLGPRATIYVNQKIRIPLPDDEVPQISIRDGVVPAKLREQEPPKIQSADNSLQPAPMLEFMLAQDAGRHFHGAGSPGSASFLAPCAAGGKGPAQEANPQNGLPHEAQVSEEPGLKPAIQPDHFAVRRIWKNKGIFVGAIRVEPEETLGHYAEWLNVPASDIRRLNGFRFGRALRLNQQIKIPLNRISKDEFEERRFEYHQELAEDFFTAYRVGKVITYDIKSGDNIWTLCHRQFEVPLWLMKRYNAEVDFNALIPSQQLLIPVIEKET